MKIFAWQNMPIFSKVSFLILSIVIMQVYSAKFWFEVTDSWIGIVLSVGIEVSSLVLWYYKSKKMAIIGSIIVITSALSHLTIDSFDSIEKAKDNETVSNALKASTGALNTAKEKKWAYSMQGTSKAIVALSEVMVTDMKSNKIDKPKKAPVYILWIKLLVQFGGLIVLQYAQIFIIGKLNFESLFVIVSKVKKTSLEVSTADNERKSESMSLLSDFTSKRNTLGMSEYAFCKHLGIPQANLTKLRNTISGADNKLGDKNLKEIRKILDELQ